MNSTATILRTLLCIGLITTLPACHKPVQAVSVAATIIRNGMVYDGSGADPLRGDVAINGDRVVAGGDLGHWQAKREVDADGLAVSPGFINILSWGPETLWVDGRGMSDLRQGVTLEVFGEGWSMGPLSPLTKTVLQSQASSDEFTVEWTTLGEYLDALVERGVSMNVASFVGAATVRMHELGAEDRAPTAEELQTMRDLVDQAMREGALGVGSSLIYAPGIFADTDELKALVEVAARHGGGYISHLRSEADHFLEALDELIDIARHTGARAEVYHLKAAGQSNWPKMAQAIERIQAARDSGLKVGANMYPYTAGATGLTAAMPPWVQEGGLDAWIERLKDPAIRQRVAAEMRQPGDDWENLYLGASADGLLLLNFKNEALKPLIGKTLAEAAALRGQTPEETAMDLVIEDHSRVLTAYFLMSDDNVRLGLSQPWVGIGSDGETTAPEGKVLDALTHPRAYGSFARYLGHYVRDGQVAPLADAIRRITRLQAENWGLKGRGCLQPGCYADVVIFDPATIRDHATFEQPHQLATGVRDVFVNGQWALKDGDVTEARAGQVVRGPGWTGWTGHSPQ